MLDSIPGVPGVGLWNERRLAAFDFPLCASALHPDATLPELDISSGWLTWGTYGDDYLAVVYGHTRDMAGAKLFVARLSLFMPVDDFHNHSGAAQRGGVWSSGPLDPHLSANVPERQAPVPHRRRGNGPKLALGTGQPHRKPHPGPG
jgi:germacradienol/geosmin synthase